MNFTFTKDQELIRKSAREFFEKECPKDKVRELKDDNIGYDPKMWKKMAKLGFTGLVIPEEYMGTEGAIWDLIIFMEEMGRNIVPCPFFETVVQCAMPILKFGTSEQKKQFLTRIAEKGDIWTLAHTEKTPCLEATEIRLSATRKNDEYVLNGTKCFVSYANTAKYFLVVARTSDGNASDDGITLFIVDAKQKGISMDIIPTAVHDMRCEIRFDNVTVSKDNILGTPDRGWEIVEYIQQYAALMKAAEMAGGAQIMLDITTKYTMERKQFDKPLGSFQGVQFRLVELLTDIEGLKYLVYEAAWKIHNGDLSRKLISMAKAKANDIYHHVGYTSIVMHGAIGWTKEMDIGLYHLRTRALSFDGGNADFHKAVVADELEAHEPDYVKLYG